MYPTLQPFDSGHLPVGDQNQIYWEASGHPKGIPALHLHGGPGGGLSRKYAQHFDPEKYMIVGFEQRGCGRSRPLAYKELSTLKTNHTQNLIADIELLRAHLNVDSWFLFGGSWGTTLALAYAQAHPKRVRGLVLAAVTTTTSDEVEWVTEEMRKVFPREGDALIKAAEPLATERLIDACYRKITDPDFNVRLKMARAWCQWEDTHMSLDPNFKPFLSTQADEFCLQFATLVLHYWSNSAFLEHGSLLEKINKISHLPCVLIHGRLDVSSPLMIPWSIHKKWSKSQFIVAPNGHGGEELFSEVTKAFDRFKTQSSLSNKSDSIIQKKIE